MRQVPKPWIHSLCAMFIALLLFFNLFAGCSKHFNDYYLSHGKRHQYGDIQLLNLHGSFCNVGREYGYLEKNKLQLFYKELYHLLIAKKHYPYPALQALANKIYVHYPQRYKNILQGMAQTSGLSLRQHIFINAFEYILYYRCAPWRAESEGA